ncbi:MAG: hypothetical protein LBP91_05680 [Coriobacteriales bacterium]|jgi:uncharacterized Zn finger protein (UPF0148 family)|nr:hypothetical protein [Coriobacteriales bacterium]
MSAIETKCARCGSEEYRLLDAKTGEVRCLFCQNRWIIPELVQKNATEKFLEEQAKRPQVIIDNTTETDRQLMDMLGGIFGAATSGCVSRTIKTVVIGLVILLILGAFIFCGLPLLLR